MTKGHPRAQPSLARTITFSLGVVALATVTVQSAIIVGTHYFDYYNLYLKYVAYEARSLLRGVKSDSGGLSFELPRVATHYVQEHHEAYSFRVLDGTGHVIAAKQPALLEAVSPWPPDAAVTTDFWVMRLDGGGPYRLAGGKRFRVNGSDVLIEIATLGDPAGIHWWVALRDAAADVWFPIAPFVILVPLVTTLAIRRAFRPLARAAQQAEAISPTNPTQRLELADIPRETAAFASAINRLIERVCALVQSQKIFIASAAHELRTPLAVMTLELERIDHPRARRLDADVAGMLASVNRLILLARLESLQAPELVDLDLEAIARETIDRVQTWVTTRDHKIDVGLKDPSKIRGDAVAVREALSNLVDNAVKHTPAGASILVTVGPEGTITVEDSGPGLAPEVSDHLFQPFCKGSRSAEGAGLGLAIVRQVVELHRGSIQVGRSPLGGAMFKLRFGAA
jgi:signal transduction histidine kinase